MNPKEIGPAWKAGPHDGVVEWSKAPDWRSGKVLILPTSRVRIPPPSTNYLGASAHKCSCPDCRYMILNKQAMDVN